MAAAARKVSLLTWPRRRITALDSPIPYHKHTAQAVEEVLEERMIIGGPIYIIYTHVI